MPPSNLISLYNNQGNKDNVLRAIQSMGQRCGPGASVPDKDGDEVDGKDEALCLVTPDGKIDWNGFMTDDELAAAMTTNIDEDAKIIILSDCCHSGTICDFRTAD